MGWTGENIFFHDSLLSLQNLQEKRKGISEQSEEKRHLSSSLTAVWRTRRGPASAWPQRSPRDSRLLGARGGGPVVPSPITERVFVPGDVPVRVATDVLSTGCVLPPWDHPVQLPGMRSPHLPQKAATETFCTAPTLLLCPASSAAAHPSTIPGVIKEKRPSLGCNYSCPPCHLYAVRIWHYQTSEHWRKEVGGI